MKHVLKTTLFCLTILASASCNQKSYIGDIPYDPVYNYADNACPYHAPDRTDTPAPAGYKPFYMSHYGRHGSRFATSSGDIDKLLDVLGKQKLENNLTPLGCELLDSVNALAAYSADHYGQLSALGAREHYDIATRMYQRFPGIWVKGGKVRSVASFYGQRCIISMANAALALKSHVPSLEFELLTGDAGYKEIVGNGGYGSAIKKAAQDSLSKNLDKAFLRESPLRGLFINMNDGINGSKLPFTLFCAWKTNACMERKFIDILHYIGQDDLEKISVMYSNYLYYYCGTTREFGEERLIPAKVVLGGIIKRADDAISGRSGLCADLRYSHDTASIPLYCAMGLENYTAAPSFSDVRDTWKNSDMMPMATNLQMVFFRKKNCGKILVKFLYNEKEISIPALQSVSGPYYDWQDIRSYWEGRI